VLLCFSQTLITSWQQTLWIKWGLSNETWQKNKYIKCIQISHDTSSILLNSSNKKKKLRGFSLQSKLFRPSDCRLSVKLVPTLADRGCRVVRATNPHGR
jgi:hypothetical protein